MRDNVSLFQIWVPMWEFGDSSFLLAFFFFNNPNAYHDFLINFLVIFLLFLCVDCCVP